MPSWLTRMWRWLTGEAWVEAMMKDFIEAFPGKCIFCSFHRYGLTHHHVRPGTPVDRHYCIERKQEMD